eukprot:1123094-Amphidinium_carterae.1
MVTTFASDGNQHAGILFTQPLPLALDELHNIVCNTRSWASLQNLPEVLQAGLRKQMFCPPMDALD